MHLCFSTNWIFTLQLFKRNIVFLSSLTFQYGKPQNVDSSKMVVKISFETDHLRLQCHHQFLGFENTARCFLFLSWCDLKQNWCENMNANVDKDNESGRTRVAFCSLLPCHCQINQKMHFGWFCRDARSPTIRINWMNWWRKYWCYIKSRYMLTDDWRWIEWIDDANVGVKPNLDLC